jgi:hypothetical protein
MRERSIGKEVALNGRHWAALAEEMLVHFSGISQDHCLVHRLRALISRRYPASFIQGGHRSGVQLLSQRWPGSFRRGERAVA